MLDIGYKNNQDGFLSICNESLLSELNLHEASLYAGGFKLTNDTDLDVVFYPFDDTTDPTRETLFPNTTKSFDTGYVLYSNVINGYNPTVVVKLKGNGSYRFRRKGNEIGITGTGSRSGS
jgi:hypothetical protein